MGVHGDVGVHHAFGVHLLPSVAAVVGAANAARVVAGKHDRRVVGVGRQGPHVAAEGVGAAPVLAPVVAAVHAVLGAGKDGGRVVGVAQQGAHLRVFGQAVLDAGPLGLALGEPVHAALAQRGAFGADDQRALAGQADVNVGVMRGYGCHCVISWGVCRIWFCRLLAERFGLSRANERYGHMIQPVRSVRARKRWPPPVVT